MRHFIIVGVLVVIVTILVSLGLDAIGLMPAQASTQAATIDNLFNLHVKVIAFLFALIVVFLVYSVVVFRRKPGETGDGDHFEGHTGLEITWTIFPLLTVLVFSTLGAQALADTRREDFGALQVKVIGSQWSWRFEYPDAGVTSDALNLPVNRQVLLKLTSTDVIHSFWVPEFRVKQDALPGAALIQELRINPTRTGRYQILCAELCGRQHAYMAGPVVVMEAAEFDAWLQQELAASDSPVARGQKWAKQFGCLACHSLDGTKIVGPTWQGLWGRTERLTDGSTVTVDEAYLLESILDPAAKIAEGFQPGIMPATLAEQLTEEQIADLIEYMKTLK